LIKTPCDKWHKGGNTKKNGGLYCGPLPHGPEKKNHTGQGKEFQDIAPDDDPVKAGVIKFDVFGKLIYK
jgi:hypothetical protein